MKYEVNKNAANWGGQEKNRVREFDIFLCVFLTQNHLVRVDRQCMGSGTQLSKIDQELTNLYPGGRSKCILGCQIWQVTSSERKQCIINSKRSKNTTYKALNNARTQK
jgi:hypothetical protein